MDREEVNDYLNRCLNSLQSDMEEKERQRNENIKEALDYIDSYINSPVPLELIEMIRKQRNYFDRYMQVRWNSIALKSVVLIILITLVSTGLIKFYHGVRWQHCLFTEVALNLDQRELENKCRSLLK